MTVIRALDLAPDPLFIARALAHRPGLAVLASRPQGAPRADDARWSFVACEPVEDSSEIVPPCPTMPRVAASGELGYGGAPAPPRWIGVVPYEAFRALERPGWTRDPDHRPPCVPSCPTWRRYDAVVRVDHATGKVTIEGDDQASVAKLGRAVLGTPSRVDFQLHMLSPESDEAHLARVRHALGLIAAGDLYEVNLARRIPLLFRGDPLALFASLLTLAPAPWGFLQDLGSYVVCAASPELAFSVRGNALRTCPIKGTRPRGRDAREDARLASSLSESAKERAELTMAVDVHRSDLGRVAVPGSVRVLGEPRVLAGRTVWSRGAEVVGRRAEGATAGDIARALLPCGSVTGAPKIRAMEVIAHLEPWRRGVYTGAFGYVGRTGAIDLAMAIRTMQIDGDPRAQRQRPAFYFAGGGIVADSVPEWELEETRWKAEQIERMLAPPNAMPRAR